MRTRLVAVATLLALFGPLPALLLAGVLLLAHAARSPDRLLDLAYAAAFCGLGYAFG